MVSFVCPTVSYSIYIISPYTLHILYNNNILYMYIVFEKSLQLFVMCKVCKVASQPRGLIKVALLKIRRAGVEKKSRHRGMGPLLCCLVFEGNSLYIFENPPFSDKYL